VKVGRPPKPLTEDDERHGTHTGYARGCRCAACVEGQARYCREWRTGHPLSEDDRRHGTINAYIRFKCRCDRCRETWAIYQHSRRDRPSKPKTPRVDLSWQEYAACADLPIEQADRIFFPNVGQTGDEARAICATCPVIAKCRSYALSFSIAALPDGIFAGLSVRQRQRIKHEQPEGRRSA
jgi:WhiB family transcriptional regulator, redox-sensing transcriptional regulator